MARCWIYGLIGALVGGNVWAQTFGDADVASLPKQDDVTVEIPTFGQTAETATPNVPLNETEQAISRALVAADKSSSDTDKTSDDAMGRLGQAWQQNNETPPASQEDAGDTSKTQEDEDVFIPEGELYRLNTPTLDGSTRGGQAFVEMDDQGRMKKVTKIFLYYDDFHINKPSSTSVGCSVRFNLLSNLDQKINRLDVKLVWPELTTTLSFADVSPNTQTYYNYALLGKGCYNMDKAPNIIVNRCRVKGMTASACAGKLLWLSK